MEVWPIQLQDKLPLVPVPLRAPDPDVPLDLSSVLAGIYEEAAYHITIDYRKAPPPPQLSKQEAAWIGRRLDKREGDGGRWLKKAQPRYPLKTVPLEWVALVTYHTSRLTRHVLLPRVSTPRFMRALDVWRVILYYGAIRTESVFVRRLKSSLHKPKEHNRWNG